MYIYESSYRNTPASFIQVLPCLLVSLLKLLDLPPHLLCVPFCFIGSLARGTTQLLLSGLDSVETTVR